MLAWHLPSELSLSKLTLGELPTPVPAPHQILVRIRAASVNPHDVLLVEGFYGPMPLPLVPLGDGAGEVQAVGTNVTQFAAGDRVVGMFLQEWLAGRRAPSAVRSMLGGPRPGVLAEYARFDEAGALLIPKHLSFEEAATLPIAGITAWQALFANDPVGPQDTVLVQGTGGVATFALQLARAAGARVIVTSSSDEKLEKARAVGATDTINYVKVPAWDKRARELTGGVGVDRVVDVSGQLQRSVNAVRIEGRISAVGLLAGRKAEVDIVSLTQGGVHVDGIATGSRAHFEALFQVLAHHEIHPVIDRAYAFEDAPKAFAAIAERAPYVGKLVVLGV